eukprot:TRINITY_DN2222_c0_g4_i1.p2 TRINITY_DN2222_c0_g4~~TRINITY_DN2222_c0_g4_i1.p2  ORF type:complete len:261 (-),score=57.82 TRINITY_DN2222_c0_g4_i1:17-724(-)
MKILNVDDEARLRAFYDKRMAQEVDGAVLGDEYAGYTFRIAGGNDKQGFAMCQGILTNKRVRLLLSKGSKLYRPRRRGERKRKSVRGCIVGADLAVLNLVIVDVAATAKPLPGLTDTTIPRPRGPKRANNIRKLFGLDKTDDVRKFVIPHEYTNKKGVKVTKRPKIQRLITPRRLQNKRRIRERKIAALQRTQEAAQDYARKLAVLAKERRDSQKARRSSRRSSRRVQTAKKASA